MLCGLHNVCEGPQTNKQHEGIGCLPSNSRWWNRWIVPLEGTLLPGRLTVDININTWGGSVHGVLRSSECCVCQILCCTLSSGLLESRSTQTALWKPVASSPLVRTLICYRRGIQRNVSRENFTDMNKSHLAPYPASTLHPPASWSSALY